jgi:hypothetical protein
MPSSAVVSVEILWGRPGTRTCGISVGRAGAFASLRSQPFRTFGRRREDARLRLVPRREDYRRWGPVSSCCTPGTMRISRTSSWNRAVPSAAKPCLR